MDRAGGEADPQVRDPVPDLKTAIKSGNVEDMTASSLADLLNDDE
jgi:hypothetical protein